MWDIAYCRQSSIAYVLAGIALPISIAWAEAIGRSNLIEVWGSGSQVNGICRDVLDNTISFFVISYS